MSAATIRERPILFSAPMVSALLDGTKSQTRRVIKGDPASVRWCPVQPGKRYDGWEDNHGRALPCPYGVAGDRLWVRETHAWCSKNGGHWAYREDDEQGTCHFDKWKPSIFMPRWASRITLEITDVRVERLQEISEDDCAAEGVEFDVWDQALVARKYDEKDAWFQVWSDDMSNYSGYDDIARDSYRTLWDSLNAKRAPWESNPWVWVVEFKVIGTSGFAYTPTGARRRE